MKGDALEKRLAEIVSKRLAVILVQLCLGREPYLRRKRASNTLRRIALF